MKLPKWLFKAGSWAVRASYHVNKKRPKTRSGNAADCIFYGPSDLVNSSSVVLCRRPEGGFIIGKRSKYRLLANWL